MGKAAWVRLHRNAVAGERPGLSSGWHLWRKWMPNFPHMEMGPGFRYLICEERGRGNRVTAVEAEVLAYLPFRPVASLDAAYDRVMATLPAALDMSRDEWLTHNYNLNMADWSGVFGFWSLKSVSIPPVGDIGSFRSHRCGWKPIEVPGK